MSLVGSPVRLNSSDLSINCTLATNWSGDFSLRLRGLRDTLASPAIFVQSVMIWSQ